MSIRGLSARLFAWTLLRSTCTWKSVHISPHPFSFTLARTYQMDQSLHICDVDAEPLHRYRKGGYHPISLGDILKDGRYRILHKLGWGGYSTVWAVRDHRFRLTLPLGRREADKVPEKNDMSPSRSQSPNEEKGAENSESYVLWHPFYLSNLALDI